MQDLNSKIAAYEEKYHRPSGSVELLAVSKGQPIEKILSVYHTGQRQFGENYLQEALPKIAALPDDIIWHFIGPVQSNKTRKIAEHFHWVQSVDDLAIAKRLNDQRPAHLPPLNICIQVNIDNEPTKSGIAPEMVFDLATACLTLPRLRLRGLMSLPKRQASFHDLNNLFKSLCQQGISLDTLSMGMSDDFEAAIAEGSTMIRIGRALFGPRL